MRAQLDSIKNEAFRIIAMEARDKAIAAEVARIKAAKWWHKFVPFTITIQRRK